VDREVAMTVRRRSCPPVAESARSRLAGQGATSLGFGAAPRTSAASATFPWLIHAPWLFGGAGVPLNHRQARIHRNNRRVPPPGVTPVMSCDDCDERGQAEAVTRSSPPLSSTGGQTECWRDWRGPLSRTGVPQPYRCTTRRARLCRQGCNCGAQRPCVRTLRCMAVVRGLCGYRAAVAASGW
jgi:hypothetical protein